MKHKSIVENVAQIIFTVCAVVAIFAVLSITIYMFLKGAPAFFKVGVLNLYLNKMGADSGRPKLRNIVHNPDIHHRNSSIYTHRSANCSSYSSISY